MNDAPLSDAPTEDRPYQSGDVIVLGPQVFVSADESVINWRGVNYMRADDARTEDRERAEGTTVSTRARVVCEECGSHKEWAVDVVTWDVPEAPIVALTCARCEDTRTISVDLPSITVI